MATILTKRSNTASSVPVAGDLTNSADGAELAVNTADKRLFAKNAGGAVVELGTNPSTLALPSGTANGVAYLNGSKVLTTGAALTFDGTNFGVGTVAPGSAVDARGANGLGIRFIETSTGNTNRIQLGTGSGFGYIDATAGVGSTALAFQVGSIEQMRLTSTGLGIGTSSPTQKLDVRGYGTIINPTDTGNNAQQTGLYFQTNTTYKAGIQGYRYNGSYEIGLDFFYAATGSGNYTLGMRLDSSGNLGLGVTPSAWNSAIKAFQIGAGVSLESRTSNYGYMALSANQYINSSGTPIYLATDAATKYEQANGVHRWSTAPSGTAGNAISFTQAMTLDAAGNLAVGGTTSTYGSARAFTLDSSGDTAFVMRRSGGVSGAIYASTTEVNLSAAGAVPITFSNNSTERARIDSSGNLLVGQTATGYQNAFSAYIGGGSVIISHTGSAASGTTYMGFGCGAGTQIGSITQNGTTAVAYNTSSDYRLKEDIQPMTGALAKVAALKPCTYKWKADGSDGEGFIAHELAEVVPQAVTGEKDAVDADGKPVYQGIDTSFLVATLTAAIQELKAEFDAYKASHP